MRSSSLTAAAVIVLLPAVLSACQTLNEAECETSNWRDLGQKNGRQGKTSSFIAQHEKACERYGIPVDGTAWRAGWEVGIREYCTPQNGLRVGRKGNSYAQSCPAELEAGFLRSYTAGKRVYDAKSKRDRLQRDVDSLAREVADASDEAERARLQSDLIVKQNDLILAQQRLSDAEREADRLETR